ncbi:MAG: protein kinase [Planctomycetaceae bacterium]|nr:protein kinase [Planctomycetaceae bacterium]
MTNETICPECGRDVPPNAPAGICPHCLLQAGLESPAHEPTHLQQFHPPAAASLSALFDQLDIESLLGQGGMGAVYRARQIKLDRLVALKILRPESASDESFAERFNREARTLARLSHPQIVGVHDFGELKFSSENESPQTLYYFLMEYVEGDNLRQLLQSGPLSAEAAISIIAQVCEALQYAHEEGVIHRDIKPENILIDARGRVKIADFGLAKLASPSDQDFTLTGTHQVMGTPRYMAPEQMTGSRAVDRRADLYSLGVVFYEMLTGDIPAGRFSPPSENSNLDPKYDDVIFRMLASRPEDRFESAAEILEVLQAESPQSVSMFVPPAHSRMGVSTIMERGVAVAWGWMRPTPASESSPQAEALSSSTRTSVIPMIIAALCLVALLLIPAPWMTVSITDPDFVRGLTAEQITHLRSRPTYALVKSGMETWSGLMMMGALIGVIVSTFAIPSTGAISRWKPVLLTTFSALALISAGAFWMEIEGTRLSYDYVPDPARNDVFDRHAALTSSISDLEHRANPQPVYLLCLGITGLVLLLSAREIGRVGTNANSISEGTDSWSSTPLVSRRFSVPGHADLGPKIVFHFSALGYQVTENEPGRWVFERGSNMGGLMATDIRQYATKLTVLAVEADDETQLVSCHWNVNLMGSWVGRGDQRVLEQEGRELEQLLSGKPPKSLESTPIAATEAVDTFEIEQEVSSPALAMIVFGCLMLLGHIGFIIFSMSNRSTMDNVWAFIPGLLPGLLMAVGGLSMRKLGSLSWTRIGIIGGFLPLSPAWIISAVISSFAHQTLQKPEVKAGFLERARRRKTILSQWNDEETELDREALHQEVSGPAIALMVFGMLCLLGHGIFFGILLASKYEAEISPIMLPGMLTGWFMFVSGLCLYKFRARGWTQFGLICGMIPLNAGWLISLPICLWANLIFQRPLVKQMFLDRSRFWNRMTQSRREQNPGLRNRQL